MKAATYFVDYAGGSDSNSGISQKVPWKHSPGDPAAGVVPAGVALAPGDTVRFKGGVTYVFTGSSGIRLNADGVGGSPIVYDGNADGSWGSGRAKFTDSAGIFSITAFSATGFRQQLVLRSLEISGIGGDSILPFDLGFPLLAKFGGGIAFPQGALGVTIEDCSFSELGYWRNTKPLGALSLSGSGISGGGALNLAIVRCQFSRTKAGCDFSAATSASNLKISACSFGESLLWPIDLPASFGVLGSFPVEVTSTSFSGDSAFESTGWAGYGLAPRAEEITVAAGAPFSLAASALASPTTTFQWRKNGAVIPGFVGPAFSLGTVSASDAGVYTVEASNSAGSSLSNAVILVVTGGSSSTAPVITSQPVAQKVNAGGSVTFTVTATGSPTPSYQWYRSGSPVAGATTSSLALYKVSGAAAGDYSVQVSNTAGSVNSDTVSLLVVDQTQSNSAPVIAQQPVSQSAAEGTTVTITAVVNGTPAPTLQWQRSGVPIPGATLASLVFSPAAVSDSNYYRLVATNAAGSVASTEITLSVSPSATAKTAPVIQQQPATQTVVAGATVTFSAQASATPAPTWQWYHNNSVIPGASYASLTIPAAAANDAGVYLAVARNAAGEAWTNAATLVVNAPPAQNYEAPLITRHPASLEVALGGTVMFSIEATGSPAPTFQWYRNGVALPNTAGAMLSFQATSFEEAGAYSAVARNAAGEAWSNIGTLSLIVAKPAQDAPVILAQPQSVVVAAGGSVSFSVTAQGSPPPAYQWQKDGVDLPGATDSTLNLWKVTAAEIGSYSVKVSNSAGTVTSSAAFLKVTF